MYRRNPTKLRVQYVLKVAYILLEVPEPIIKKFKLYLHKVHSESSSELILQSIKVFLGQVSETVAPSIPFVDTS